MVINTSLVRLVCWLALFVELSAMCQVGCESALPAEQMAEPIVDASTSEVLVVDASEGKESRDPSTPDGSVGCTALPKDNMQKAWAWVRTTKPAGTGMVVWQNGKIVFESYAPENASRLLPTGGAIDKSYSMYSQTKTLTGLAALLLARSGKISLDDQVSMYLPSWNLNQDKRAITIRELLTLSSGIQTEVQLPRKMKLSQAIASPFVKKQFAYGTEPFLVFAAVVQKVLSEDAYSFLKRELFDPLGMSISIQTLTDGTNTPNMASGGRVTLREVLKLGVELKDAALGQGKVLSKQEVKELLKPGLNPAYGLTIWRNEKGVDPGGETFAKSWSACGDTAVFHLLGAGGQVLTIVPEKQLVIAKSATFGAVDAQSRTDFWDILFQGVSCACR